MANLLVLHPTARDAFIELGGGKALSLALAGKDNTGMLIDAGGTVGEGGGVDGQERVFLLARLAFLGSVDKAEVVREMVDTGDIIDSLCYVSDRSEVESEVDWLGKKADVAASDASWA